MRKVYLLLFVSAIAAGLNSCTEDLLPKPVVSFSISQDILEVNVPATFDNATTNATTYEWDFGDGQTSTDKSPTIFYEETGSYTVTLKATTDDNQSEESTLEVTVGERKLYEIVINTLSFVNNEGADWDTIDPDSTSFKYPDFWFLLGPNVDPTFERTLASRNIIFADLSPNLLALVFSGSGALTTLSDEKWSIAFFDFDGVNVDTPLDDDEDELMSFVEFNPVKDAAADEKGEGELIITKGLYSVTLVFKVE